MSIDKVFVKLVQVHTELKEHRAHAEGNFKTVIARLDTQNSRIGKAEIDLRQIENDVSVIGKQKDEDQDNKKWNKREAISTSLSVLSTILVGWLVLKLGI